MKAVLTKLKKIGVNKIDELVLIHVDKEWEAVITIIKVIHENLSKFKKKFRILM